MNFRKLNDLTSIQSGVQAPARFDCLQSGSKIVCEYPGHCGVGISDGGPGDKLGRAIDTVSLLRDNLQKP